MNVNRSQGSGNSKTQSCQTYTTQQDIDMLETFRQKYLETLSRMKSDMMKEFDAQTLRVSERVTRQINQERSLVKEKINQILFPKVSDLLKEFRVSDTMIRIKMDELDKDLEYIIENIDPKKPISYSNQLLSSMRSSEGEKLNKIEENLISNSTSSQAKRSASALTNTLRPTSNQVEIASNLYSKSASSMRDIQPSIFSKEIDLKPVEPQAPKPTGSIVLSSGYKYTPLRQSWSNLSQMNPLSPYLESPLSKKIVSEEINSSEYTASPNMAKSSRKYINFNRPQTAESILSKEISEEKNQ